MPTPYRATAVAALGPAVLRLEPVGGPRGVDVRLVDLAADAAVVAAAAACLAPGERAHADRGTPQVRRRRILLRAALRRVLAEALGVEPGLVPLADRPGRPALRRPAGLDAGCAAAGGWGLVAVSRHGRVGIDVEQVGGGDVEAAFAEGWLSDVERAVLLRLPQAQRPWALTRAWVQKEAVLKGEGVGLFGDLPGTVTPMRERGRVGRWELFPVPVPDGLVAGVAVSPLARWR